MFDNKIEYQKKQFNTVSLGILTNKNNNNKKAMILKLTKISNESIFLVFKSWDKNGIVTFMFYMRQLK